jgi:hypothetical protein
MKLFLYCFLLLASLVGCALDPVEEKRQEQARLQEEKRWASLSPKQKCMERAEYDKKFCNVQCALGNVDGRNPQRYQQCTSICIDQQLSAFQICSYK